MSKVFVILCIRCHCLINLLDRLKGLKWSLLRQGLVINKPKLFFTWALGEQWHLKTKCWQTARLLREKHQRGTASLCKQSEYRMDASTQYIKNITTGYSNEAIKQGYCSVWRRERATLVPTTFHRDGVLKYRNMKFINFVQNVLTYKLLLLHVIITATVASKVKSYLHSSSELIHIVLCCSEFQMLLVFTAI